MNVDDTRALIETLGGIGQSAILAWDGGAGLWTDMTKPPEERKPASFETLTDWLDLPATFRLRPINPATANEPVDGTVVAVRRTYNDSGIEYWYLSRRDDATAVAEFEPMDDEDEQPSVWALESCCAEWRGTWAPGTLARFDWADIAREDDLGIEVEVFTLVPA